VCPSLIVRRVRICEKVPNRARRSRSHSHRQNQPRKGIFWDHALLFLTRRGDTYDAAKRTEIDRSDNNVFLGDLGPGARALNGVCRIRPPSHKSLPVPLSINFACVAETSQRLSWKTGKSVRPLLFIYFSPHFLATYNHHPSSGETAQPFPGLSG
jgi:hypothetical protein